MAAGIIPTVRLMFACDHAEYLADDEKWVLKHPWTVMALCLTERHFHFESKSFGFTHNSLAELERLM